MKTKTYEVKTVEEAKKLAVEDFGVSEEYITFEVLTEKKGFLGFGGKSEIEAKIDVDGIQKGKDYIQMILDANGIKGFIEKKVRDNNVEFNIEAGDFNGFLIGKNSRSLIALQTLVSIIVNNFYEGDDLKTVLVDVGGYKKRREKTLESMAVNYGKQVVRTKTKITLDSLNAYERKIIHNKLSTWKDVQTHSEGEEPERYLIIEPK